LLELSKRNTFDVGILVTGTHLSHEFGHTVDEIREDGFRIDAEADILLAGDTTTSTAMSLGLAIILFSREIREMRPDLTLVYGDRFEALAAAIASAYAHIPVVHMHGGDTAGGFDIDDSNRHAITHFAHIHLVATQRHAERVRSMGEDPRRVHVVGSPALDSIRANEYTNPEEVSRKYDIDPKKPLILVLHHPVTSEEDQALAQVKQVFEAVRRLELPTLWIFPNAGAGARRMIRFLEEAPSQPFMRVEPNIASGDFLGLLNVASVMIGNSSSALIEAPSFGLPAVNIGNRQVNRDRAENVIDVDYDATQIEKAVRTAISDEDFRKRLQGRHNPYGDGQTSERVAAILESVDLTPEFLRKGWYD
jgi:UDP-hydrolysing UDP-N-acetyl-D-glucosamine 2-epimerase